MRAPDNIAAPSPPARSRFRCFAGPALGGFIALVVLVTANMILPPRWQPDLHIKNTGASAVVIVFKDWASTTPPGETWHNRFRAGDTLTVRAGQAPDAPSHTLTLPARNPKPWTLNPVAQRWTAEVNADDPENIRFENRFFTEVTIPPSPLEPWP